MRAGTPVTRIRALQCETWYRVWTSLGLRVLICEPSVSECENPQELFHVNVTVMGTWNSASGRLSHTEWAWILWDACGMFRRPARTIFERLIHHCSERKSILAFRVLILLLTNLESSYVSSWDVFSFSNGDGHIYDHKMARAEGPCRRV